MPLIITGTDVDDVCSMGEAVDHGFREAGVRKHLGPLAERDTIIDTRPLRSLITWSTSSAAPAGKAKYPGSLTTTRLGPEVAAVTFCS